MMICPALAWLVMRLAVWTATPNTSRVSMHDRAEMAADPDRDLLTLDLEVRVPGNRRLHFDRGVDRRVAVG